MNRTLFVLLIGFLHPLQALGQSSLSGQGKASTRTGSAALTINVNEAQRVASGVFRYEREANSGLEELVVTADANCLWISLDGTRAVVAGEAAVQSNPARLATKEWFFAAVLDNGSADRVRSGFVSRSEGLAKCQSGETAFPALVDSGDFTIRRGGGSTVSGASDAGVPGSADGSFLPPPPQRVPAASDTGNSNSPLNPAGNPADSTTAGSLSAPVFDGAVYIPFDGNVAPGQIVTKAGAAPPTFVPGKYGQAIFFNDRSAIAVPLELSPVDTPQITVTAWIRRSPGSSMGKIFSTAGTGHPVLQIYGGSVKKLRASGGRDAFSMTIEGSEIGVDQWTFVAAVLDYERKTMWLHVDDKVQFFDQKPNGDPLRMDLNNGDVRAQRKVNGPGGKKGYYVTIWCDRVQ